ncbi:MAG: hypothetical protein WBP81_15005 [Solirubrobacteraceae bacterium]
MLPIPPVLSEQLERQEELLVERYPEGTDWLLPSPPSGRRNGKGGAFHVSPRTINGIVKRYVKAAGIHAVGASSRSACIRICFATTWGRAWSMTRFR